MHYASDSGELILAAGRKARNFGHSYVGSVHFLLALAESTGSAGFLLRSAGVEPELTELLVAALYGAGTPDLPLPQGLTVQAKRILRRAGEEAKQLGRTHIVSKP